ncbi:inorganic pyrophosphatase-like [Pomacea canaliculata]|uniref:inorganic pyrophosphatase-like n=1 Tax=Pomacea canaliculata TaxID=400727 RepID=UPI000D73ACD0|nr:inorganic pyrophosphatase-like [Pomacea canaliculata]
MQRGSLCLISRAVLGERKPAVQRIRVLSKHLTYSNTMSYSTVERGQPNTLDYRVFFRSPQGKLISPFHDIPLYANQEKNIFNMVVEIPRWSNAKMEINKEEKLNPIKQDVKSGRLRYVKNIFPHHGYIWNYGALPQTWENPKEKFPETGTAGDNDPLDVCEIGHKIQERGSVIQVKVLGTLLLIDEGETDWKIIAIDVSDPLASKLNDINDVHQHMPGFLRATYEWFRYYKKPDGKPENTVHWNGECKGRDFALEIVEDANKQWHRLVSNSREASGGSISCANTTLSGSSDTIREEEAETTVNQKPALGPAAPVDQEVNQWYYVIPSQ